MVFTVTEFIPMPFYTKKRNLFYDGVEKHAASSCIKINLLLFCQTGKKHIG